MHDATKVQLGATRSSDKSVINMAGSIEAGVAVRLKSDGTLSVAKADGELLGISLGKDLSNTSQTAICRRGLLVPIQIESGYAPALGAQIGIKDTTGKAAAPTTGVTAVNAVCRSAVISGLKEDGVTYVDCILVDMQGGL